MVDEHREAPRRQTEQRNSERRKGPQRRKEQVLFSQRIGAGMSGGRIIKEPMIVAYRMIEEISK